MDEIGMFAALRPQPGPLDVSGARDRLAATITGAPDRRRVSRRTRFAAAAGGLAAAAATAVTAVTLTVGSAPPALATVTTALTRTLTQSYNLTEQDSSYYIENGQIRYPSHDTCVSEVDPVRHLEASSCRPAEFLNFREVGGYLYLYSPQPVTGHPGVHWNRVPVGALEPVWARLPDIDRPVTVAAPQQMLSVIKKAAKVAVAGSASGPGWAGTRYAFSASPYAQTAISGTLAVDRQGRARALVLTTRSTGGINVFVRTQALTFSDFGARATVTPPPADQTISMPY